MGVYIANLDRTRSGVYDYHPRRYGDEDGHHGIENEDEDSIILTKMAELNGETVAGVLTLKGDRNFIQSEPFDDIPDDEDFEYHHGLVTHYLEDGEPWSRTDCIMC